MDYDFLFLWLYIMEEEVIVIYRQLHQTPEIGLKEHQTTQFILNYLK